MKINNPKKIPKFIGILFLLVLLFVGIYATSFTTTFNSRASQSCSPVNIQITNLTFQSFDISFLTSKDCQAYIDINGRIFADSRKINSGKTHYFQVDGLNQKTAYNYKIVSDGVDYIHTDYKITTFSNPNQTQTDAALSWGRVFDQSNKPAVGSIIYLNIPGVYPLSAPVTAQAYWSLPLVNSYTIDGKAISSPPTDTVDEIIVLAPDGQTTVLTNNTGNRNPVPDIILGNPQLQSTSGSIEFDQLQSNQTGSVDLTLQNPQEGENLNNAQPLFFGQGPAGQVIEIELNSSSQISDSITVSPDGSWQWTPPTNLEPGDHSISLKYTDPLTGLVNTITRNFTVLAQSDDTNPAFTASSSATLAPSSPTLTKVPSITPTGTQKPTSVPTNTPMPTATKFISPSPTLFQPSPTPAETLPQSGGLFQTLSLIIVSFVFIIISALFLAG